MNAKPPRFTTLFFNLRPLALNQQPESKPKLELHRVFCFAVSVTLNCVPCRNGGVDPETQLRLWLF